MVRGEIKNSTPLWREAPLHKRPTSNLVKIASFSKDKSSDMTNAGIHHTTMTEWIGADCPVDFLNVWFPAHWAPIVLRELHRREDAYRKAHNLWFDDPHVSDPPRVKEQRKDALRSRELQFQIGAMDNRKNLPTFIGKLKEIGLTFQWTTFSSNSLPSRMVFFVVGCLSNKLLVPGVAAR